MGRRLPGGLTMGHSVKGKLLSFLCFSRKCQFLTGSWGHTNECPDSVTQDLSVHSLTNYIITFSWYYKDPFFLSPGLHRFGNRHMECLTLEQCEFRKAAYSISGRWNCRLKSSQITMLPSKVKTTLQLFLLNTEWFVSSHSAYYLLNSKLHFCLCLNW